jgi:hypothetical protein
MDYNDMTTKEVKKLLIDKMVELKGVNYALGWLRSAYVYAMDEDSERSVAIKQLQEYNSEGV